MKRHALLAVALAALVGGILPETATAQTGLKPFAGPKTIVKLGVSGRPDQAFLELALRRGYFEEQGLQVETVQAGYGSDFVAPLAMNQVQVASGTPNASLFNALNRGIDIKIVADFAHLEGPDDGVVSIVVRRDLLDSGAIKTAADLKGRTLSLGGGRGQYPYILLNSILEKAGMNWSDVNVQSMSFADSIAAMNNKVVDGGFMIEPLIAAASKQNVARILVLGGSVEAGAHLAVLVFSPEFARQSDAASRFMIAYLRGARDYRDAFILKKQQDAAIEILTKYLPVKDPEVWKSAYPQYTDVNGALNVADIKRQAAIYKKLGDISGPVPDIDRFVEKKFAEEAVKTLGRR